MATLATHAHVPHKRTVGGAALPAHRTMDGEAMPAHIMLYLDDTRPGNVLHAAPKRSYYGVYRAILELPGWFRNSPGIAPWQYRNCPGVVPG